VTVHREGKIFEQEYRCGAPQYPVREIGTSEITGTTVRFWPDRTIFQVVEYNKDILEGRLRELAFLNRKLTINITDLREKDDDGKPYFKSFYSEGGIVEFVEMLDKNGRRTALIPNTLFVEGFDESSMVGVEVAMTYNDDFKEHIFSYVNNINTVEGGTHVTGFRQALTRVFKTYGDKQGLFERAKVVVEGDDFREGLSAIISVKVPEPQFEGQTKTKLGNTDVGGIVQTTVARALEAYLEENPREAKNVISKIVLAAQARVAARKPVRWFNVKLF
jgi:DNA gyrase subunit B